MPMSLVTCLFPKKWLEMMDELVYEGLYGSRSEFIRYAVRDALREHGKLVSESISVNCPPERGRRLALITLWIPKTYLRALDTLVENGLYANRAEAIRYAIKDFLKNHQ